jgi:hypothetical protein
VLNVGGVLTGAQFMLVMLLAWVSVSSVWCQTDLLHQHVRYMRMYFNLHLLGFDNMDYYEDGDNID